AQGVEAVEVDDPDLGQGGNRQFAGNVAADRGRAAEGRGLGDFYRRRLEINVAHDLSHQRGGAHVHDHVARIGVAADGDVDAGVTVAFPVVERTCPARDVDRAV